MILFSSIIFLLSALQTFYRVIFMVYLKLFSDHIFNGNAEIMAETSRHKSA